jgi:hypothetical protein
MNNTYEFITMTREQALSIISNSSSPSVRDNMVKNYEWSAEKAIQFDILFPASQCAASSTWTDEKITSFVQFLLDK